MVLAPIVLFVYNRPRHTRQTVEALKRNTLASQSELFVFSDAPVKRRVAEEVGEVREYLKSVGGFKKVKVIMRDRHLGLADNIIDGVTEIVQEYQQVIVLEDDLLTSPYFLRFMNDALEFYRDKQRVWHISGWNYPIETGELADVFLWRVMNCWGWATWSDRWRHFEKDTDKLIKNFSEEDRMQFNLDGAGDFWNQVLANKKGKINTWAIYWYAAIFKNNGLCLNPAQTFVENIGHDGSGHHSADTKLYDDNVQTQYHIVFPEEMIESEVHVQRIKDILKRKDWRGKRCGEIHAALDDCSLTEDDRFEIKRLLERVNREIVDPLEQMWYLLDLIWDENGCDNKHLNEEDINKFYSHPVWLLNGLFIEQHDASIAHRSAIRDWVIKKEVKNIVDYGGGFGTLARMIAGASKGIHVDIYEPFFSDFGLKRTCGFENIAVVARLESSYDCLICTDVLEHMTDPLDGFARMIQSVDVGGYLIIANAFFPVIKCHLPRTFHLRYTFNFFAKIMGLKVAGRLSGGYATIYQKVKQKKFNWFQLRQYERISRALFPVMKVLRLSLRVLKRKTAL